MRWCWLCTMCSIRYENNVYIKWRKTGRKKEWLLSNRTALLSLIHRRPIIWKKYLKKQFFYCFCCAAHERKKNILPFFWCCFSHSEHLVQWTVREFFHIFTEHFVSVCDGDRVVWGGSRRSDEVLWRTIDPSEFSRIHLNWRKTTKTALGSRSSFFSLNNQ